MTRALHGFLAVFLSFLPAIAQPQNYPQRPVRMIVPFNPGGSSDFVARVIQPKMTELLGQQVVVDNRAGASGNIGVELRRALQERRRYRRVAA